MSSRKPQQVLIAGAGVAGLEAVLALQALTDGEVSVELVAPEAEFTYRPLAVTEPFGVGEVKRFPLRKLAEAAPKEKAREQVQKIVDDVENAVRLNGAKGIVGGRAYV